MLAAIITVLSVWNCVLSIVARGSRGGLLRFKAYISGIIHRVILFIGLRGSLAADQTARILHVLLATLLVWLAAAFVATIPFAPVSFPRIFNTAVVEASYATALVLLWLGYFRHASVAYLAGTWIWAMLVCSFFGGVHSPGVLLLVSLPASAAWLLGYEAAIGTAGGCLFSALVFMLWEVSQVGHPLQREATPLGIWAVIVQAILINAIPVGQIIGRLRESQRRLVSIYNTVEDAILHLATEPAGQFRILSVNASFLRLTGLKQEEVVGKTVNEVIPEPSLPMVLKNYRQAIEEKAIVRWEETSDYPAGRLTGEVSVAPVFDNTGTCTHLVGSIHDITQRKRSEKEAFARQKLESLGVLAGGIAHDFNNLLGGIHSVAELVEMDLAVGSAPREEIEKIKTAAIRGSEIVRELMIYAGENQKSLNEAVDVSRLVEEMLQLLKVSISKQVALRTDFGGDLPLVRGSAPQIRQVVMNLVLNASEAIGDTKGVIAVSAAQASGGRDLAPNNATDVTAGEYVRIEVSDTGCGMTEEIKTKIFDPFFSTKFAGRGLGLAVVQGIVRDLGGAINIVSAPGQGTAFQVFLPSAPKRASEIHSTITSGRLEKSNANRRTILVVEDDQMLRRAVSMGLQKRGFSVIEASDGTVALDLIRAHKYEIDVVLLDVTLPGASSREVFEEVLRIRPDLKVIVTSAYDEQMVDAYYSGLRVNHFIRKPFHLDDLVRLAGTALSAKAH